MKTWHYELLAVATVLAIVALLSGAHPVEWIGSAAVLSGFGHAQIAERLAEREAARPVPSVECWRKLVVYFVAKEILWASYFVSTRSWSALVGCGVFALYPIWRKYWRRVHPIGVMS